MNLLGNIVAQLRGRDEAKKPPAPESRRERRALARRLDAHARTAGQREWRRTFGGIVTVAEARTLSTIDARSGNQRKGAARRRARAVACRQMMPPHLRYIDPVTRFLMDGPRG